MFMNFPPKINFKFKNEETINKEEDAKINKEQAIREKRSKNLCINIEAEKLRTLNEQVAFQIKPKFL